MNVTLRCFSLPCVLLVTVVVPSLSARADVDYNFDIQPLLSDRCYRCHGPDAKQRQADLRLDTQEGSRLRLKRDRLAILPGDPSRSEVYRRITSTDPDVRMPPPESKLPALTADEAGVVERWIREGAEFSSHWSLRPLTSTAVPEVSESEWPRNPIDRFVFTLLAREGLNPAQEATREELIRRVSFDLTGLPPTIAEIDAFLGDTTERAYENVVDLLLASERYGERMVVDWLDLARYSDTYGYQTDGGRRVWPWRDWVVGAFNKNLPYDQFLTEQLAGDLLPDATDDQILATAFNRLHGQKAEGGSTEAEFRTEYVADRVHTFGTAFLGLTLECARCHDHKYDPVTQKEYYQLFAYFNNIDEFGLRSYFNPAAVPPPALALADDGQKEARKAARRDAREQEAALDQYESAASPAFDDWLRQRPTDPMIPGLLAHFSFDALEEGKLANSVDAEKPATSDAANRVVEGATGGALELTGDDEVKTEIGSFTRNQPFALSLWIWTPDLKSRAVVLHRSRAWTDAASRGYQLLIEEGKLSASLIHFWPGNAMRIRMRDALPLRQWLHVVMVYDGSSRASGLELWMDGQKVECDVVRDRLTRKITGGGGDHITLGARFRDRGFAGGCVDELRVYDRTLTPLEIAQLHDGQALGAVLERPLEQLSRADRQALRKYWLAVVDGEHSTLHSELSDARKKHNDIVDGIVPIMVMRELEGRRPTHVLRRGAYDAPTDRVSPGTPASLPALDEKAPPNRLGLAQWLTHPGHPLTARVAVNRFWQMVFGEGLVRTPEDFGSQGERPTHPRLLDWLSRDFIANGWDVKALMHTIVMSATYRQSSRPRDELEQRDPDNRLLARGPRHRLPAEMIRDAALAASGLLVEKIGGPPTKPYEISMSYKRHDHATGPDLYRRSVYTHWQRTGPAPVMMALDAAKRDICMVKRERTSTPLQALVLLNATQFAEAARVFGERVIAEHADDVDALVAKIFRSLTARKPSAQETSVLRALYEDQLAHFRERPEQAAEYLKVGDRARAENLPSAQVAAAGVLALAILNHDDCLMKR